MVMPLIDDKKTLAASGAETQRGRRPNVVSAPEAASPELVPARRRRFSAKDKLRILGEADRAAGVAGGIGALLRREGLYASALSDWRRQRDAGAYQGLIPARRGPKPAAADVSAQAQAHAQLLRDNANLTRRLERAEAIIDLQKKVAALLGVAMANDEAS